MMPIIESVPLLQAEWLFSITDAILIGGFVTLGIVILFVWVNFNARVSSQAPLEQMLNRIADLEKMQIANREEIHDLKDQVNALNLENAVLRARSGLPPKPQITVKGNHTGDVTNDKVTGSQQKGESIININLGDKGKE